VPLHPFGEWVGNGQRFVFDAESLRLVREQLSAKGTPFVLDWHHASVQVEEGTRDRAPAAAFITDIVVDDGFVYGVIGEWTAQGAQDVMSGAYQYTSSVFYFTDDGHIVGYHSHGLTNRPGTHDQRRIGLEAEERDVNMKDLIAFLGLAADATNEEVTAALEGMRQRAELGGLVMEALELTDATTTPEVRGRVYRLVALESTAEEVAKLRVALEADRANASQERTERVLRVALETGRIFEPETAMWRDRLSTDFEGGRAALEAMPVRVPTKPVQTDTSARQAALEGSDAAIARLLGVTPEMAQKYGGGDA
jgi:phage I-like protein